MGRERRIGCRHRAPNGGRTMMTSRGTVLVTLAAALLATLTVSPPAATAKEQSEPLGFAEKCSQLATDPRLLSNPGIKTVSSSSIAASGGNKAYCQVNVLYGT